MPGIATNGNYGQYGNYGQQLSPALTSPIFGPFGMPGGFENQGLGQVGQLGVPGQVGQNPTNIGNLASSITGDQGFGYQSPQQQPFNQQPFNQQLATPQQQFATQQQIAAQRQVAAQQLAVQQQQIATQQQQIAHGLQQLANQAAMQGVTGQQTAATLQHLAQCVAAQSVVCQQVARRSFKSHIRARCRQCRLRASADDSLDRNSSRFPPRIRAASATPIHNSSIGATRVRSSRKAGVGARARYPLRADDGRRQPSARTAVRRLSVCLAGASRGGSPLLRDVLRRDSRASKLVQLRNGGPVKEKVMAQDKEKEHATATSSPRKAAEAGDKKPASITDRAAPRASTRRAQEGGFAQRRQQYLIGVRSLGPPLAGFPAPSFPPQSVDAIVDYLNRQDGVEVITRIKPAGAQPFARNGAFAQEIVVARIAEDRAESLRAGAQPHIVIEPDGVLSAAAGVAIPMRGGHRRERRRAAVANLRRARAADRRRPRSTYVPSDGGRIRIGIPGPGCH